MPQDFDPNPAHYSKIASLQGKGDLFGLGNDAWLLANQVDPLVPQNGFLPVWDAADWTLRSNGEGTGGIGVVVVDPSNQQVEKIFACEISKLGATNIHVDAGKVLAFFQADAWVDHVGRGEYVLLQSPEKGIGLGWTNEAGHSVVVAGQMQLSTQFGKTSATVDPVSNTIDVTFGGAQSTKIMADVGPHHLEFYRTPEVDDREPPHDVFEDLPDYETDPNWTKIDSNDLFAMDADAESDANATASPINASEEDASFGQFFVDDGDSAFDFAPNDVSQYEVASPPTGENAGPPPTPSFGDHDVFVYTTSQRPVDAGSFDPNQGPIDLTELGLSFEQLSDRLQDNGWATEIDLSGIEHGTLPDKIILPDVKPADLVADDFIF